MKFLFLTIVVVVELVFLSGRSVANADCPSEPIKCLNLGVYNKSSCSCGCFPGYSGLACQYMDCTRQSAQCGTLYTPEMCHLNTIYEYCPKMCENTICTCGFDTCLNNGTFNSQTCSCTCLPGFYGSTCESTSPTVSLVCPSYFTRTCQNGASFNRTRCKCDCNKTGILVFKQKKHI